MRRKQWDLFVFLKGANRARSWDFSNLLELGSVEGIVFFFFFKAR